MRAMAGALEGPHSANVADNGIVCHLALRSWKGGMLVTKSNAKAGRHTITPYFTVESADLLIDFLTAAFGATLIKENRYSNNRIQHARLLIGDSLIMLNQSTDNYPPNMSQMHIVVEDTDQTYQLALQLGATSLMEPNLRPHGERMAGIKDPCGNVWWIASPHIY